MIKLLSINESGGFGKSDMMAAKTKRMLLSNKKAYLLP